MAELDKFTRTQAERFQRHFALAGFGIEAQARLLDSRVVVIGAGGLGAPILTYLAAAGVGEIDIIDHDVVDRSNLHRQVIHSEDHIGEPKAASAAAAMRGLHPEARIYEHRVPITAQNAEELLAPGDLVIDGSDNFATRYVVSDACEITGKPLISGSILRFAGQVGMFWSQPAAPWWDQPWPAAWTDAGRGPTYRDLYPEAPDAGEVPTCAEAGVIGVLPGVIGSLMAAEAVKFLAQVGDLLLGRVITYDALTSGFTELTLSPDPDRDTVTSIGADVEGLGGGPEAITPEEAPTPPTPEGVSPTAEAEEAMDSSEDLDFNPFTGQPKQADELSPLEFSRAREGDAVAGVLDVREPWEYAEGAVEEAVNLPLMQLWNSEETPEGMEDSTEERPFVVYCAHGIRSRQAVELLKHRYPNAGVKNLLGGYELFKSS